MGQRILKVIALGLLMRVLLTVMILQVGGVKDEDNFPTYFWVVRIVMLEMLFFNEYI